MNQPVHTRENVKQGAQLGTSMAPSHQEVLHRALEDLLSNYQYTSHEASEEDFSMQYWSEEDTDLTHTYQTFRFGPSESSTRAIQGLVDMLKHYLQVNLPNPLLESHIAWRTLPELQSSTDEGHIAGWQARVRLVAWQASEEEPAPVRLKVILLQSESGNYFTASDLIQSGLDFEISLT